MLQIGSRVEQAKKRNYQIVYATRKCTDGITIYNFSNLKKLDSCCSKIRGYQERIKRRSVFEIVYRFSYSSVRLARSSHQNLPTRLFVQVYTGRDLQAVR